MSEPNEPSHKPGEVAGRMKPEQIAAEQPPEAAEHTNPVGEATQRESKDPYAEGKPIANPEPNNGQGVKDSELDPTETPDAENEKPQGKKIEVTTPDENPGQVYDPSSQPSADER